MKRTVFFILLLFSLAHRAQKTLSDSLHGFRFVAHLPEPTPSKGPLPAIFLLHGYGSNENDLFELRKSLAFPCILISIRAPLALPQGGFAWYEMKFSDKNFVHNVSHAIDIKNKLSFFIKNMQKKFTLDTTRTAVVGFSQGGMMAWMLGLTSKHISHAVILSSYLPDEFHSALRKEISSASAKTFWIGHGRLDALIPAGWCEKTIEKLKKYSQFRFDLHLYDIPHSLSGQELMDFREYLKKSLIRSENPSAKQGRHNPPGK